MKRIAVCVCFISFLGFLISACSYQLEGSNPALPSGKEKIAIIPIQNQTLQAGLDTRLMRHLRELFRSNTSVQLKNIQDADLILEINLTDLDSQQTSISADGLTVAIELDLEGSVILRDRSNNETLWRERQLGAKGSLLFEKGESSTGLTGSTLGRGLDAVTEAFAKRVYERIFYHF